MVSIAEVDSLKSTHEKIRPKLKAAGIERERKKQEKAGRLQEKTSDPSFRKTVRRYKPRKKQARID